MRAQASRSTSFAVTPPPVYAWGFLVAIGGVLPLAILGALWLSGDPARMHGVLPALVGVPAIVTLLSLAMKRRSVELHDGVLDVRAALFRYRVAATQLDPDRARIVDLAERTELRPVLKTGGMSLPGFHAGRFRLRDKFARAFCLVTDRRRVLWLPQRDGKNQLVLSLEDPQALLDVLNAECG